MGSSLFKRNDRTNFHVNNFFIDLKIPDSLNSLELVIWGVFIAASLINLFSDSRRVV